MSSASPSPAHMASLSPAQQTLYNAILEGKSQDLIQRELKISTAIFTAQCTRIRNKGITINVVGGQVPTRQATTSGRSSRPASADGKKVIKEAFEAGKATYDVESLISEAQNRGDVHGDMAQMHPMAIMGLTIQFMRLCGGRFHAHQIIEDVYGAIRAFAADGPSADEVVEMATRPFSASGDSLTKDDLAELTGKMDSIKDELAVFVSKLQPTA